MINEVPAQGITTQGEVAREDIHHVSSTTLTMGSNVRLWLGCILTLSVPLMAGFLCGAKSPWMRGVVFGLMALTIIVTGKERRLPRWSGPALIALSIWSLVGLLPQSWFQPQNWRVTMSEDFGIAGAATLSPQPWVTVEAWLLLTGGIVWIIFCLGAGFMEKHRRFLLRGLVYGITVMALLALIMKWGEKQNLVQDVYRALKDPRYLDQFGLFPNRNNFAGFCVSGFLLALMMTADSWQKGNYTSGILLALCAAPNFIAVLESGSRGGVLLLGAGTAAWLISLMWRRKSKQHFSVAAALVLIIGSCILIFGKPVVQRFIVTLQENGISKDARIHVFQDTLTMLLEQPYIGIGLGNFENVFPQYQLYTNNYTRFIHPENDWLWLAAEAGVIGLFFAISAAGIIVTAAMRRGRVKTSTADRHLRHAALIVAVITGLQGLMDTPGHLLANALTALLLLCIATHRDKSPIASLPSKCFTISILFLVTLTISINSLATSISQPPWPSRSAAKNLRSQVQSLINLREPAAAELLLSKAIEWEPMAWDGYFMRACVHLQMGRPSQVAIQDFARARFLEPNSSHLCMLEATFWTQHAPAYAVQAWREAMRREPGMAVNFYYSILPQLTLHPDLHDEVRSLANTPELKILFLSSAGNSDDFKIILNELLTNDPMLNRLSDHDQFLVFRFWSQWGDREELLRQLRINSLWRKNGWLVLADELARLNDPRGAYEMAMRYVTPPPVRDRLERGDIESLRKAFLHNSGDVKFAFDLYEAQKTAGLYQDAMSTLKQIENLDSKSRLKILYEKSLLLAATGDFVSAWEKIRAYALP